MFLLSRVCPLLPLSPLKSKLHKKPTTKKEVSPNRLKPLQKLRNFKVRKVSVPVLFPAPEVQKQTTYTNLCFFWLLFITVSVITEVRGLYFGPVFKSFEPKTVRAPFIINLIKRIGSLHKRRNDCAMKHLKNISFRDFLLKSKTCFISKYEHNGDDSF